MRISIAAPLFDLDGHITIDALESSDVDAIERRVSRVRTLDGTVAYSDGGFAHGDRTVSVLWRVRSVEQWDAVSRIMQDYSQIHVSMRDGCYLCAPSRLSRRGDEGRLELMLLEKRS